MNRLAPLPAAAIISAFLAVTGCSNANKTAFYSSEGGGLESMRVSSPAFSNRAEIPKEFTADGRDISPPLSWTAGPPQTKQYVLIVEDPDAPGKQPAIHWIVYGIPPNAHSLPAGASSPTDRPRRAGYDPNATGVPFTEGQNYKGLTSYVGAEPPPGSKPHHYVFQVFAVDQNFNLPPGATKPQVLDAMNRHVLAKGELTGTYKR